MSAVATSEQAAAIAAAIERFLADTAPPPPTPVRELDRWTRAAMLEGVSRTRVDEAHPWVDAQ